MKPEKYLPGILLILAIPMLISINHLPVAKADAAPPPGAYSPNLISPDNATNVRMESETVIISPAKDSDYTYGHAIVTAEFHMRNLGEEREEMLVRFPMNNSFDLYYEISTGNEYCYEISDYPSITNFEVWVNDQPVYANITTRIVDSYSYETDSTELKILNCWAKFNVVFPPDQDVIIKVKYKVAGYHRGGGFIEYTYVLTTGAGWRDTIGSADIIARFPYEVDDNHIYWTGNDDYIIEGNDIIWHYENFEPEDNIEFSVINPLIWNQVLIEQYNVKIDPNNGEAWGRLGKYYKEAITQSKGFLSYSETPELFQKSMDAYKKALELLPNDIDWHYGYMELVCKASMIEELNHSEKSEPIKQECNEQLRYILDHDPDHEDTLVILQWVRNMTKSYPDGEIAEYLVLTPMPTRTATSVPSSTAPFKTSTLPLTWTPSPTKTELIKTNTPTPSLESYESSDIEQNRLIFSIGANILLVAFLFFAIRPDRSNK